MILATNAGDTLSFFIGECKLLPGKITKSLLNMLLAFSYQCVGKKGTIRGPLLSKF